MASTRGPGTSQNPDNFSGSDASTQVSLLMAPAWLEIRGRRGTAPSPGPATRVNPPGIATYESWRATAKVRSTVGRASRPVGVRVGTEARATISWPTQLSGCASIRRRRSSRSAALSSQGNTDVGPVPRAIGFITRLSSSASTWLRLLSSPHHHVCTDGSTSCSPRSSSARRGR